MREAAHGDQQSAGVSRVRTQRPRGLRVKRGWLGPQLPRKPLSLSMAQLSGGPPGRSSAGSDGGRPKSRGLAVLCVTTKPWIPTDGSGRAAELATDGAKEGARGPVSIAQGDRDFTSLM